MKLQKANGLTADNSQPANLLSKTKPNCTTKRNQLATIFIAANAVLTGVATGFATIFAYANYGIWAVMPPAFGLMTVLFWSVA